MAIFPLIGPSYVYSSVNFDAQRSVNCYPIKSDTGDSKAISALVGTPGLNLFCTLPKNGIRGEHVTLGRAFFVVGNGFYEIFSDGTVSSLLGTLLTLNGQVSMSDNGFQVMITDNPNGYLFIFASTTSFVINGTFDADVDWTKGAGWTIAAGVATATGAISTALSQDNTGIIQGVTYTLTYTITRSAGTITPNVGGTAGTTRNAAGTYTETIVAGSTELFAFNTSGFTGTVDNVTLTQVTDQFVQILDPDFPGAVTVTFSDSYFIVNKPNTQQYYISAQFDGGHWDALDFASAEAGTDNLVAVEAVHGQIWLFGTDTIEVHYDNGDVDFPYTPIKGALIEYGCVAAYSVTKVANTVFWLGSDLRGQGIVWMAQGYQPQKISTDAIEFAIQSYSNISDAVSYAYQEEGHHFLIINFPSANTTWAYDVAMNAWHERAYWNLETGAFERHRGNGHIFAFNKHLVGDYSNGNVYEQSLNFYTDNGNPIRRMRTAQHIADDLEYLYYNQFQLDMQTGIGLSTGDPSDVDPQIELSWSDDGGHSYSNEHARSAGKIGEYRRRAIWRRLGRSRDRVFRVVFTAACKFFLIACHIDLEKSSA